MSFSIFDLLFPFYPPGRYHDDLYDRYWWPMSRSYPMWKNISTVSTISNYIIPLPVIQTAIEAVSKNTTLEYNWRDNEGSHYYKTYMYFADFQNSQLRQFNISFNTLTNDQYSPLFLSPSVVVNKHEWYKSDDGTYTITLKATAESILPPMINALEVYTRISHTNPKTLPTDCKNSIFIYSILFIAIPVLSGLTLLFTLMHNYNIKFITYISYKIHYLPEKHVCSQ